MFGNGMLRLCFLLVSTLQSSKTKRGAMGARVIGEYWVKSCCDSSSACEDQRVCLETSELLRCSKTPLLLLLGYRHPRVLNCMACHLQQHQYYHDLQHQDHRVFFFKIIFYIVLLLLTSPSSSLRCINNLSGDESLVEKTSFYEYERR